ncbi:MULTISPECIES: helix-turn-helix transcriptional regulator [Bacillaceae]|uniref:helix-turn-helix transcriptional regulator n=1 Tax=Bacillaceae TaxID=186817 RepID=UPI000BF92AD4|nr:MULTISPECIES: helix-turn-helix transcriptional regulator [Bacillus]MCX2704954.1 helix-turn-helix transcriptional regulator [Bacillus sp. AS_5]MCW4657530.1 helix-turn-helix domain-containing protein [Bacillus sp. AS_3]MDA2236847.1 helix-turn-helix transcriptional regulator [Bacillus cereus]MDA2396796.1 helix-turn-helix transcriptional regulator [Bacillus cereus]MEB9440562.1 helix-turn-helix transcriptional regulator [Bacillus cereus]
MYQLNSSKLKLIRGLMGVTQKQFADLVGVDTKSVSAWEVGRSIANQDNVKRVVQFVGEKNFEQIDAWFYSTDTQRLMNDLQRKVSPTCVH